MKVNVFEDYFIVDSMPLEVVKLSRSTRSKICKEDFYTSPNKGYCASQSMYYYGYKIHAVCLIEAELSIFSWIETWYNKRRIHSFLGYKTINEFETEMYNQNVAA
ncbi:MAG: hypothetical protein COC16_04040 [Lutibacter sp.]|nr:MAG: hypothetical protein COC16_04040 [Lutibacter sp.]